MLKTLEEINDEINGWDSERQERALKNIVKAAREFITESNGCKDECQCGWSQDDKDAVLFLESMDLAIEELKQVGQG